MIQLIIDYLHIHYGIVVTALMILPMGADRNATVYRAETADGLPYF